MGDVAVADCHNDLLIEVLHRRERGYVDPFGDFWLPQLRAGGVRIQVLPICTEQQFIGEGALRRCLLMIEEAYRLASIHSADVELVRTRDELVRAQQSGKIALVLALEGAEPVGNDLAVLDVLNRLGVTFIGLTWNRRTMMADGVGERATDGALTGLGVEAVAEIERLQMILDVSHLSDPGFWHVERLATRPYIASHSSCRGLERHPRNLSDPQLKAIARSGGFVALNAFGPFLGDDATVGTYLEHVSHAVSVVGADHVALGPDFIEDVADVVDPILTGALVDIQAFALVPELRRPEHLRPLAAALYATMHSDVAEAVTYGTMSTFLTKCLP